MQSRQWLAVWKVNRSANVPEHRSASADGARQARPPERVGPTVLDDRADMLLLSSEEALRWPPADSKVLRGQRRCRLAR